MIVSDNSTLILISRVGILKTFLETIDKIIIPGEVYREIMDGSDSFETKIIEKEIGSKIFIKKTNKDIEHIKKEFRLDEGEAAAYSIYDKKVCKAILTDDRELMKVCKLDSIPFLCAPAIVVKLYEQKKITKDECLEKIENLERIGRYSKEIINYFKGEVK